MHIGMKEQMEQMIADLEEDEAVTVKDDTIEKSKGMLNKKETVQRQHACNAISQLHTQHVPAVLYNYVIQ